MRTLRYLIATIFSIFIISSLFANDNAFYKVLSDVKFKANSTVIEKPTDVNAYFKSLVNEVEKATQETKSAVVIIRGNNDLGVSDELGYIRAQTIVEELKKQGLPNVFAIGMGSSNRSNAVRGALENRFATLEVLPSSAIVSKNGLEISNEAFTLFNEIIEGYEYHLSVTANVGTSALNFYGNDGLLKTLKLEEGLNEHDVTFSLRALDTGSMALVVSNNGKKHVIDTKAVNKICISAQEGSCVLHFCRVSKQP